VVQVGQIMVFRTQAASVHCRDEYRVANVPRDSLALRHIAVSLGIAQPSSPAWPQCQARCGHRNVGIVRIPLLQSQTGRGARHRRSRCCSAAGVRGFDLRGRVNLGDAILNWHFSPVSRPRIIRYRRLSGHFVRQTPLVPQIVPSLPGCGGRIPPRPGPPRTATRRAYKQRVRAMNPGAVRAGAGSWRRCPPRGSR